MCVVCSQRQESAGQAQSTFHQDVRSVKSSVALYFALLGVSIVTLIVTMATKEPLTVRGMIVVSALMALVTVAWCIASARQVGPTLTRVAHPLWYALGAVAAIGTYLLASMALRAFQAMGLEVIEFYDRFELEGYGLMGAVVVVCVMPAIFEELAFRGVIQSSLSHVLGSTQAVLVTTMLFAILHLSLPSMPHLVTLGLALGYLRARTGSLYPCMLLHFCHNLLVILSEQSGRLLPW